jgi:hypothetical protein
MCSITTGYKQKGCILRSEGPGDGAARHCGAMSAKSGNRLLRGSVSGAGSTRVARNRHSAPTMKIVNNRRVIGYDTGVNIMVQGATARK